MIAVTSADLPVLVGIAGPLLAAGYYLWRVQHSLIGPMDHRLGAVERKLEFERQERLVCEWRHARLVRWMREQPLSKQSNGDIPDDLIYGRPEWSTMRDPLESEEKK